MKKLLIIPMIILAAATGITATNNDIGLEIACATCLIIFYIDFKTSKD